LAGIVAFFGAEGSVTIQNGGIVILAALAALGVALTAIVATVLALIVALFDDAYRIFLQKAPGGWPGAMRPFKIVATTSILTTATSMIALFAYAPSFRWLQSLLLAIPCFLAMWSLVGTLQLINMTSWHGEMRFNILQGMDAARRELLRRRREKHVG